ncbi:unnamed protein product, partial [Effrenium voratum]
CVGCSLLANLACCIFHCVLHRTVMCDAFQLQYRNSFIEVEEVCGPHSPLRAKSAPPCESRGLVMATEVAQQDADVRTYLHALARNLQADEGQTEEVDLQGMPSLGSIGHPEVCRRPCIYFSAGHCELGEACNYCHVAHTDKAPKLDKRQRLLLQAMDSQQMMALIFPFCSSRVEQAGLQHTEEVLGLLQEQATALP